MRTGAIFARGSCRALKWLALFGVVFALGVVDAAAQLSDPRLTIEATESREGGSTTVTVTMSARVQSDPDPTNDDDHTYVLGLTVTPTANPGGDNTPADPGDWEIADDVSQGAGTAAELELTFENTDPTDPDRKEDSATFVLHHLTPDDDAEHEDLTLTVTLTTGAEQGLTEVDPEVDDRSLDITIMDAQDQRYVLKKTSPDAPMEGGDITVTLEAMPKHVQGAQMLTLRLDQDGLGYAIGTITGGQGTPGANTVTLGADVAAADGIITAVATDATNMATIPLSTTVTNDGNRNDDMLTVSAFKGVGLPAEMGDPDVDNDGPLVITIADENKLPEITAAVTDADGMAVTDGMLMEGMTYMLTLSAPAEVSEGITVALTASGTATATDDYSLGSSLIMIPSGEMSSAPVSLEVDLNDDIEDDTLMFSAEVAGEAANGTETDTIAMLLSLTLVDATMKLITVKDDAMDAFYAAKNMAAGGENEALNPGEWFEVARTDLFEAADGYMVRVSVDSSDTAVVTAHDRDGLATDSEDVFIYPRAPGTAMITITGTAVPEASGFMGRNVSRDVAEITVELMVELATPGMPRNLTATAGDGQVTLSWNAPSSGGAVAKYQYREAASSDWTDTTATTATVTGLTNGTRYVFHVRAVNDAGNGPEATVDEGTTPMATPVDESQIVKVKSVSAATSVAESGGLEVTVTATVPAGTKGADGKIAAIASKQLMVSFPTDDPSIMAGEDADAGELTPLGATNGAYTWTNIARKEEASEATYKFRVAVGQDLDAEDEKFQVHVSIDGDGKKSKVVTIDDAQEQKYTLSLPSAAKGAITEGKSAKLTLKADPKRTIDIPVTLALEPNDPSRYSLSVTNGMFGMTSLETTVSAKADSDRADDTLTVTAYTDLHGEFASLDITIKDANALPAVKATLVDKDGKALDPQPESVMEGETVKVMLTAVDKDGKAMKAAEKLTITLMSTGSADAQDYRLSSQSFEIASGKESSAAVDLMITEDQDVGEETLMFDAAVAGEAKNGTEKRSVAGVLSLMITDATQKLVWANSQEDVEAAVYAAKNAGAGDDMTFTAGEMIEVMGSALFSSAEGVTLSYTASSSMSDVASASVSGGTVMVTAMAEGMADITITAHASMASGAVTRVDQTDPGQASVMFMVEVGLEALSIMLMGPEDMNLVEGGMGAMVTATANRAVAADTMVMLMRDRAMSSAGDDDYTADAITIMAGETMGSTMVMAVEDNMMEDMEELVLYGMTEGMAGEVTGGVHLYLWDAAVPALPVIAQLLLAAFLAVGGYRRYRRR